MIGKLEEGNKMETSRSKMQWRGEEIYENAGNTKSDKDI